MHTFEQLNIAAVAAAALATGVVGQQTRPADKPDLPTLKVNVWTCPSHDQFRLGQKGACPLC